MTNSQHWKGTRKDSYVENGNQSASITSEERYSTVDKQGGTWQKVGSKHRNVKYRRNAQDKLIRIILESTHIKIKKL